MVTEGNILWDKKGQKRVCTLNKKGTYFGQIRIHILDKKGNTWDKMVHALVKKGTYFGQRRVRDVYNEECEMHQGFFSSPNP